MKFNSRSFKKVGYAIGVLGTVFGLILGIYALNAKDGNLALCVTALVIFCGSGLFLLIYSYLLPVHVVIGDDIRIQKKTFRKKSEVVLAWSEITNVDYSLSGRLVLIGRTGNSIKIPKELSIEVGSLDPALLNAFESFNDKPQVKVQNFIKVVICRRLGDMSLLNNSNETELYSVLPSLP